MSERKPPGLWTVLLLGSAAIVLVHLVLFGVVLAAGLLIFSHSSKPIEIIRYVDSYSSSSPRLERPKPSADSPPKLPQPSATSR